MLKKDPPNFREVEQTCFDCIHFQVNPLGKHRCTLYHENTKDGVSEGYELPRTSANVCDSWDEE